MFERDLFGHSFKPTNDVFPALPQALSELHDKVPPFPQTVAMKIIEDEFGSPVERIFSYISEDPVAAASFGQVVLCFMLPMSIIKVCNNY